MYITTVQLDERIVELIKPILKRNGMSLSGFLRKSMADYVDEHEAMVKRSDR